MALVRLTEAPLKQPVLYSDLTLEKVWLQYVAELAEATAGYWGNINNSLEIAGITTTNPNDIVNKVILQGTTVSIYLRYNGLTTVDAIVSLEDRFSVLDGPLTMTEYDDAGLIVSVVNLFVKDSQFELPDTISTDNVLISGQLIKSIGV